MGSIIEGTMAVMGMIGGLMLAFTSFRTSEPKSRVINIYRGIHAFPADSQRKAA